MPRHPGQGPGPAGIGSPRRRRAHRGAVQCVPVLQVGRPSRNRPRRVGRGARPGGSRPAGAADDRHVRIQGDQAQGRRVSSRAGDRGHEGAAVGIPRPAAAAGPQRGVDGRDLDRGGIRTRRRRRVPRRPDTGPAGHGRSGGGSENAPGDQHVRGRLRPARTVGPAELGVRGSLRPPLLGWSATVAVARRDL